MWNFKFLSDNLGGIIEQVVKQERYRRKKSLKYFKLGTALKATQKDRTEKYIQSGLWYTRMYKI